MSDKSKSKKTKKDLGSNVGLCFCCKKQFDKNEMDYIDKRYVCKSCNHLPEKEEK